MLNYIKNQKAFNEDVINKLHLITVLFDQIKEVSMSRIDESEIVIVQLVNAVDKVNKLQLYRSVRNIRLRA